MKKLYVAWQNEESREWVPVAMLTHTADGYFLQYTRGAKRCKSFSGFGRMGELDQIYFSPELFPFFSNRLISKSRPEYKDYLRWLGLNDLNSDPMSMLSVTGGIRATDSFELIPSPRKLEDRLILDFFPRGLNHFPNETLKLVASLKDGAPLYLLKDIQNPYDDRALLLRTDEPKLLVGFIARYYCSGLLRLLDSGAKVSMKIKQVNRDAPLDMRILCTLETSCDKNFQLIENEDDFLPWTATETADASLNAIQRAAIAFRIDH